MPAIGPDPRRWRALALLCVANFMVTLDSAIVILALPSIHKALHFSSGGEQWVISAYLLSFGGLLLLGGRSADLLGRRRMFMIGTVLFLVSSLLCGLAWTAGILVGARVLQGLSAAIMAPTALSMLVATFDDGAERNKALGFWTITAASGGTAALLIGGVLTDVLGWEWIFFINVPVAIVMLALSPVLLRESRQAVQRRGFDPVGAITVTAALVALVFAVAQAPKVGWGSLQTIGLLAVSAALIAIFIVIEKRSKVPLVPLRMFRSRNLVGGNLLMLMTGMLAFGTPFVLTTYAQQVLGYSALRYGLSTVAFTGMAIVGAFVGQTLVGRIGFRAVGAIGMALLGGGALMLTRVPVDGKYLSDLFFALLVFGTGLGSSVVAASIAALTSVPERDAGLASGVNTATFQIGGAIGVAIISTIVVSYTVGHEARVALTAGSRAGFIGCVSFGILGVIISLLLLRRPAPADTAVPVAPVAASETATPDSDLDELSTQH